MKFTTDMATTINARGFQSHIRWLHSSLDKQPCQSIFCRPLASQLSPVRIVCWGNMTTELMPSTLQKKLIMLHSVRFTDVVPDFPPIAVIIQINLKTFGIKFMNELSIFESPTELLQHAKDKTVKLALNQFNPHFLQLAISLCQKPQLSQKCNHTKWSMCSRDCPPHMRIGVGQFGPWFPHSLFLLLNPISLWLCANPAIGQSWPAKYSNILHLHVNSTWQNANFLVQTSMFFTLSIRRESFCFFSWKFPVIVQIDKLCLLRILNEMEFTS